jgi:hypothetical protein
MSIKLMLEETNPAVENVLLALRDIPEYDQIETLELALAWLKLVRRPHPLTFTHPHQRCLVVGDCVELDSAQNDTYESPPQVEPTSPINRRSL